MQALTGSVRCDPLAVRSSLVCVAERLLVGASDFGSFDGSVGNNITAKDGDVGEELSDLGVGKDELGENLQVLDGLVAFLLRMLLRDGRADTLDVLGVTLSVELACVCGEGC